MQLLLRWVCRFWGFLIHRKQKSKNLENEKLLFLQIKIMFSVYKLNMTIMSFKHKRSVDIWCPRWFNGEITFNKHAIQISNFRFSLEYVAREDNYHNTKRNESQCYIVHVTSMLCYLFCPKKQDNWFYKNFHNSGRVSPTRRWVAFFNAISIDVQYMLSFQWTNFGLKCLLPMKQAALRIKPSHNE